MLRCPELSRRLASCIPEKAMKFRNVLCASFVLVLISTDGVRVLEVSICSEAVDNHQYWVTDTSAGRVEDGRKVSHLNRGCTVVDRRWVFGFERTIGLYRVEQESPRRISMLRQMTYWPSWSPFVTVVFDLRSRGGHEQ